MRSIIIICYYNHYHCCHLYSGGMFMRSVIIGHRPKLAVLPKLVFNAQRPVANSIATANQRIIASCNPTSLPKNDIYERVGTGNNNKENDPPTNTAAQTRRPLLCQIACFIKVAPSSCLHLSILCLYFLCHPTSSTCQHNSSLTICLATIAYSTYKIIGCQGCQDKLLTKLFTQCPKHRTSDAAA